MKGGPKSSLRPFLHLALQFFSFVDTIVARKLHFRYKMHVETYTHDVVFTKIIMTCLQQSWYFCICFVSCHVMPK